MSRTIRIPPGTATSAKDTTRDRKAQNNAALLASVAGEEDPGAAVDAPAPPPRSPLKGVGDDSPGAPQPGPSRPSRSS